MVKKRLEDSESAITNPTKDVLWFFAMAGAVVSGVDALMSGQDSVMVGLGLGLGLGSGLLFGLGHLVIHGGLNRLSSPWRPLIALGIIALVGHLICDAIDGYTRLVGPHPAAGALSLVIAFLVPVIIVFAPALSPRGYERPWRHWLITIALFVMAIVFWLGARQTYPDFYPGGMMVTLTGSIVCLALSMNALRRLRGPLPHWLHRVLWAVGLGLLINAFVYLQRSPIRVRMTFETTGPIASVYNLKLHRAITDWDGDGYSWFLGDGDCASFNAQIHPGAAPPNHCPAD
ncbi:MAG: hypothetical protein VX589_19300 [Myxococcota bacterium]|nr:hypothetical protein [Myxococcota bacterium]